MSTPEPKSSPQNDPPTPRGPAPQPDFADEAGPKTSEFATEKDAKEITEGDFDRMP